MNLSNYHFKIASYYGMPGDRELVLERFKEGFKIGKSTDSCYIYSKYEYEFLHGDPEFTAFLKMAKIPFE